MLLTALNTNTALAISRRDRKPFVFFDAQEVHALKTGAKSIAELPFIGLEHPAGWTMVHQVFGGGLLRLALDSLGTKETFGFGLVERRDESREPLVGVYRKL